jgi:hypothetical protein
MRLARNIIKDARKFDLFFRAGPLRAASMPDAAWAVSVHPAS